VVSWKAWLLRTTRAPAGTFIGLPTTCTVTVRRLGTLMRDRKVTVFRLPGMVTQRPKPVDGSSP